MPETVFRSYRTTPAPPAKPAGYVNAKDGTVYVVKHGQLCEVNLKTTDPDIAENYDLALNVFQAAGKTQEQLWRMCAAVAAVVRG